MLKPLPVMFVTFVPSIMTPRVLPLSRQATPCIVTDRNRPIAVLHGLDQVEKTAGIEERLASLAHRKRLRMPADRSPFQPVRRARGGREASDLILGGGRGA